MMRRRIYFSIVLLLVPVPLGAQEQVDAWTFDLVRFPPIIDSFEVHSVYRWPQNPALGDAVKYVTRIDPSAEFDVYIYPRPPKQSEPDSALVFAEFSRAMNEVRDYARDNRNTAINDLEERPYSIVATDGRHYAGYLGTFTYKVRGEYYRSTLIVLVRDRYYVKLRASHGVALQARLAPRLEQLMSDVLASVVVR